MIRKILALTIIIQLIALLFTIENKLNLAAKILEERSERRTSYIENQEIEFVNKVLETQDNDHKEDNLTRSDVNEMYFVLSRVENTTHNFGIRSKSTIYLMLSKYWEKILELDAYEIY